MVSVYSAIETHGVGRGEVWSRLIRLPLSGAYLSSGIMLTQSNGPGRPLEPLGSRSEIAVMFRRW